MTKQLMTNNCYYFVSLVPNPKLWSYVVFYLHI